MIQNNITTQKYSNVTLQKPFALLFTIFSLTLRECEGLLAMLNVLHYRTCGEWAKLLLVFCQTSAWGSRQMAKTPTLEYKMR